MRARQVDQWPTAVGDGGPGSRAEGSRAGRAFLGRSVRYLVGEVGIRQLLDIGTGLPKALLTGAVEGATEYIDADMNDPEAILERAAKLLDLSQPVGLLFMGVLGHISDHHHARRVVTQLMEPLAGGSHLALYDGTLDPAANQAAQEYEETGAVPYVLRSPEQLAGFFDGLELVDPGFVSVTRWRPDDRTDASPELPAYAGVARKN